MQKLLIMLSSIALVQCQIPAFGACPDHPAMKNFNRENFFGTWYEIERYFTVSEVGAKCVTATYEKRPDGKIYINNAYTNRFTGVQRIITGQMKLTGKTENEGLYNVRYSSLPIAYDTVLKVLDTDYDTFSVIWSCSAVGPIGHTESVWVMAREREPSGLVLQRIYGVLDKFKINRTFFIQSDQKGCETLPPPLEAIDPTPSPTKITSNKIKSPIKLEIIQLAKPGKTVVDQKINDGEVLEKQTEQARPVEVSLPIMKIETPTNILNSTTRRMDDLQHIPVSIVS